MDIGEIEQSKGLIIVEIIEYIPNAVLSKTIIKKSTGNISIMSFDTGEGLTEKISPFDTFAQIIDGTAEIVIDGVSHLHLSRARESSFLHICRTYFVRMSASR